jgi:hypothetical protein
MSRSIWLARWRRLGETGMIVGRCWTDGCWQMEDLVWANVSCHLDWDEYTSEVSSVSAMWGGKVSCAGIS